MEVAKDASHWPLKRTPMFRVGEVGVWIGLLTMPDNRRPVKVTIPLVIGDEVVRNEVPVSGTEHVESGLGKNSETEIFIYLLH